ncbi:MAG: flagellar motor switch phosphatase FliY [Synergistaceae bacterium]|jgi:flagellar motor switch protein FliN/FliY|nr:flagellar motor switch phosphatase FliY [Synergistaceae bacterium]
MVDEFLNQDEIDALLSGEPESEGAKAASAGGGLTQDDLSVLNEVVNIIAGAASNVIGMLAGRDVATNIGEQSEVQQGAVGAGIDPSKVFSYSMTLNGLDSAPARLLTGEKGALALADLMMGGDAKELPTEANDLYLSAAQEGLSQLVGSALTNLSGLMSGARLSADDSTSALEETSAWLPFASEAADMSVWVGRVDLTVEGVEPFSLSIILPVADARNLAEKVREAMEPEPEPTPAPAAAPQPKAQTRQAAPQQQGAPAQVSMPQRPQGPPVDVRPVEFAQLGGSDFAGSPGNIDLIVDIPVRVTVELGRTRKTIGEVLSLGPGSVVELNKMAGEPVDVLVNGKLIARGEVVVIDESFGIRVTEVVSRAERIRSMGV